MVEVSVVPQQLPLVDSKDRDCLEVTLYLELVVDMASHPDKVTHHRKDVEMLHNFLPQPTTLIQLLSVFSISFCEMKNTRLNILSSKSRRKLLFSSHSL